MAFLSIKNLEYWHGKRLILPRISMELGAGNFACLLGPSGCGKTTLLRLIAGLEQPQAGSVSLDGKALRDISPDKRQIGMVFQQPALFPMKTVFENVGFGLPKNKRSERTLELLEHIGLAERADAYPQELSGGQQHRVALARALAPSPKLLLLDEPFAHLDLELRVRLREETKALALREGVSCLMVTHDGEEAMQTGDVIVLMDEAGRIRQQGTPHDVFHHPVDQYAAMALGDMNLLAAASDGKSVSSVLGDMPTESNLQGQVLLGIRPQGIAVEECEKGCEARVESVTCTGPEDLLVLTLNDGQKLRARLPHTHHWRAGDTVSLSVRADYTAVFAV